MFYGITVLENNSDTEINLSEQEALDLLYNYEDALLLAETYEDDDYILTEGANIEITKKLKEFKKNYSKYIKAGKKALRKSNTKEAADNFGKARKELELFRFEVRDMDSTVGSAVFGTIAGMLIIMANITIEVYTPVLIPSLGISLYTSFVKKDKNLGLFFKTLNYTYKNTAKFVKVIGIAIAGLYQLVVTLKEFIASVQAGDKKEDSFNLYRTELMKYINELDKRLSTLETRTRQCDNIKQIYEDVKEARLKKKGED